MRRSYQFLKIFICKYEIQINIDSEGVTRGHFKYAFEPSTSCYLEYSPPLLLLISPLVWIILRFPHNNTHSNIPEVVFILRTMQEGFRYFCQEVRENESLQHVRINTRGLLLLSGTDYPGLNMILMKDNNSRKCIPNQTFYCSYSNKTKRSLAP